jgi:hypothetical protein
MDVAKAARATSRLIAMDGPPQQPQADDDGRHDGKQEDGVVQLFPQAVGIARR